MNRIMHKPYYTSAFLTSNSQQQLYLRYEIGNPEKNCRMLLLNCFMLRGYIYFSCMILIGFQLISIFKADESFIYVKKSAGL